jgi:hypothetical protein
VVARRQRNHSRHGPRQAEQPDDAVRDWAEWLDHQYDPGYYVGGRIPPLLRRTGRRSPYGYVLLAGGGLTLILVILFILHGPGLSVPGTGVGLGIAALEVGAGLRLARGRRR